LFLVVCSPGVNIKGRVVALVEISVSLCGAAYILIDGVTIPSSVRGELDIFVCFYLFFGRHTQTDRCVDVSYVGLR
jgi:hypothetical protein